MAPKTTVSADEVWRWGVILVEECGDEAVLGWLHSWPVANMHMDPMEMEMISIGNHGNDQRLSWGLSSSLKVSGSDAEPQNVRKGKEMAAVDGNYRPKPLSA